jgi:hypothetical protein
MADNVEANAGSGGETFATDDISNVQWPFTKLAFGPRDTAHEVEDAASKRIPVKVGDGLAAASVVSGKISLSGGEAALSTVAARRFRLKADLDNTDKIYLGTTGVSATTGLPLDAGDVIEMQVSNLNVIHGIVGAGTQVLYYLGEV